MVLFRCSKNKLKSYDLVNGIFGLFFFPEWNQHTGHGSEREKKCSHLRIWMNSVESFKLL